MGDGSPSCRGVNKDNLHLIFSPRIQAFIIALDIPAHMSQEIECGDHYNSW
jgi:hypothetical protein